MSGPIGREDLGDDPSVDIDVIDDMIDDVDDDGPDVEDQQPEAEEDLRGDLRWGSLPRLVEDAAARFGDAEAIVDHTAPAGVLRLTFDELEVQVDQVLGAAIAAGVERGDRVAIWAPNCAEWVVAALGVVAAGAVLVPLNTRYKGSEAAYILRKSGAKLLLTVQGFLGFDYPAMLASGGGDLPDLERVVVLRREGERRGAASPWPVQSWTDFLAGGEEVPVEVAAGRSASVDSSDLSDLIFTSGTTGRPKGAMATHGQTLRTFSTWADVVGLQRGDRYLIVNPFFHTFGYKAGIIACLMAGATMVPEPVFDVDRVLNRIAEDRVTVVPGPPTLYQSILDRPDRKEFDLSSLRLAVTGAAVVPVVLVERMRSELEFETVLTAYGLTESTGVATMCRRNDSDETIATTSGRAIPGVEVKVVDDGGVEVPRGQAGEIVVRGYNVTVGYWDEPEETRATIDRAGWLHTGDVGVMDHAGNIRITDRLKDMFVVGGFNVYPAEIESMLLRAPGVQQVAVVGVPDERMGEVGCAFVVPSPDASGSAASGDGRGFSDALLAWAREEMANFKVPRHVRVVDALPLNASGKVLKRDLREQFSAGD